MGGGVRGEVGRGNHFGGEGERIGRVREGRRMAIEDREGEVFGRERGEEGRRWEVRIRGKGGWGAGVFGREGEGEMVGRGKGRRIYCRKSVFFCLTTFTQPSTKSPNNVRVLLY